MRFVQVPRRLLPATRRSLRSPCPGTPHRTSGALLTPAGGSIDRNTIGHRPGDWERPGPAHVFRLDRHGEDVWVREIDACWSNQDILVADSDGDGEADVLVNGPGEGG